MRKIGLFVFLFTFFILIGAGCMTNGGVDKANLDQASPESVVESFYSVVEEDPDLALTLIDEETKKTDRFVRTFDKVSKWHYVSVDVLGYEAPYVDVKFEIEFDGDVDSGTDQAEVVEKNGKWWIVDLPS